MKLSEGVKTSFTLCTIDRSIPAVVHPPGEDFTKFWGVVLAENAKAQASGKFVDLEVRMEGGGNVDLGFDVSYFSCRQDRHALFSTFSYPYILVKEHSKSLTYLAGACMLHDVPKSAC